MPDPTHPCRVSATRPIQKKTKSPKAQTQRISVVVVVVAEPVVPVVVVAAAAAAVVVAAIVVAVALQGTFQPAKD